MPNCTSAFRFMEHYYCFHGHMFSKFDPKTGEVHGKYPKEARDYFMRCASFSEYQSDNANKQIHGIIVTLLEKVTWSNFEGCKRLVCCSGEESDHVERERCSRVHLDAITSDKDGNMYAFRGELSQQFSAIVPHWFPHFQEMVLQWCRITSWIGHTPPPTEGAASLKEFLVLQATISSAKMRVTIHWRLTPSKTLSKSCTVRWTLFSLMRITFIWSR